MRLLNEKNVCPREDLLIAIYDVFESVLDLFSGLGINIDAIGIIRSKLSHPSCKISILEVSLRNNLSISAC